MHGRHRIKVDVAGVGEIEGCGTGYQKDIYSFGNPDRIDTWRGRAMVVVRPTGDSGEIKVTVTSEEHGTVHSVLNVEAFQI